MSTPSSIVGEQNSTGSCAVAELAPRAPRARSGGTWAVCSRASMPWPSAAIVAVEVDEERVRAAAVVRRAAARGSGRGRRGCRRRRASAAAPPGAGSPGPAARPTAAATTSTSPSTRSASSSPTMIRSVVLRASAARGAAGTCRGGAGTGRSRPAARGRRRCARPRRARGRGNSVALYDERLVLVDRPRADQPLARALLERLLACSRRGRRP